MIQPDIQTFKRLASKGNLVAVRKSIPADLDTPVSVFLKLAAKEPEAFLLESAEQEEKIGRYSFIGFSPSAVFTAKGREVTIEARGKAAKTVKNRALIDILQDTLQDYKLANPEDLPAFCGGLVGYLSYENVQDFETIRLSPKKQGPGLPDGIFFLAHDFLIFDHFLKTLSVVTLVPVNGQSLASVYSAASKKIEKTIAKLRTPLRIPVSNAHIQTSAIKSNTSHQDFLAKVAKVREYIKAGDCIQVVLSQRLSLPPVKNDFQIYRALRTVNPSPYMFYFRSGKYRLIGSSPELLVKKTGSEAEVRPIAGTRPRGKDSASDLHLEEQLKKSVKEMAEHLMLVDLGRNDLGRVCEFESVKVKDFARVERYSHVMHLVSDVCGKLKKGQNSFDLLKATFPAGTVSGAPKIRAMQIIDELEPERRGPYAGCLGYFSHNQDMDMCITIRTLFTDSKKLYLQAGAGIVKDSNPQKEYEETLNKAKALLRALEIQGEF